MKTLFIVLVGAVALCYCAQPSQYGGYQGGAPGNDYGSPEGVAYGGRRQGAPLHYPSPSHQRPLAVNYQPVQQSYPDNKVDEKAYSKGRAYGRQMEYTMDGPNQTGKMKVTETHVQMDRRMDGQEAEQAMKKIMGSMHGDSKSEFATFVKDLGFPEFARY